MARLGGEPMASRFIRRFASDGSYDALTAALRAGQGQEAFRAAHTLKGVAANLGLERLKNDGGSAVTYTAVLYRIRTENVPVQAALEGEGFADTEQYALPENAARENVLRAVTGKVEAGRIQDFDIRWLWRFDDGPVQDQADTALGDSAAAGRAARVTLGFYLVVSEEPGQWIRPDEYKTGDGFPLGWYVGMMAVTGGALAVLGTGGRRRRGDEDEKGGQTGW